MRKLGNRDWSKFVGPWTIACVVIAGAGYWYWTTPNDEALQRERICKNWGYSDAESLEKCGESQHGVDTVIAPKFRRATLKAISDFNEQVAALAIDKTVAKNANYQSVNLQDIAKRIGGMMPMVPANGHIPLEGARYILTGRIITNTPDTSDDSNNPSAWQPQTFELWGPQPKSKNVMPDIIHLDIESLNRNERRFLQTHCDFISFTQCHAVIRGHVGRINEDKGIEIPYIGIVVDQLDVELIDVKAYRAP